MPKSLIITEKPSVAHDITEALGGFINHEKEYWESDQFICTFAVGHILELISPEEIDKVYKRWTLEHLPIIPDEFKLKPKEKQTNRVRLIKKLVNRPDVSDLINACDAGREGELIFREVVKYLDVDKPTRRLWLQSMTPEAIRHGFASLEPGEKFDGLGAAAECRSLADWLIGINASRALTVRLRSRSQKSAWSAGRVQTPTLALLVEREHEILKHIPIDFWRIECDFAHDQQTYRGTWYNPGFKEDETQPHAKADRVFDKARAEAIVAAVTGKPGVASEKRKPSRDAAPPLFDLTSLQREANRRFGWSAARTLRAAQGCYETHKVLTYPRTDSRCLPSDYVKHVEQVIDKFSQGSPFAKSAAYLKQNGRQNDSRVFNDKGVSDHFAIIPTGQLSSRLSGDDQKLFDLVSRRFLATFFPPAIWEQVDRRTVVGEHHFQTKARSLRDPGWRSVFGQEAKADDPNVLPALVPGQEKSEGVAVNVAETELKDDKTKPPPRITEARLLSLMENAGRQIEDEDLAAALDEKGLGTPATRAEIIENLKNKQYVDKSLRPTVKGMRFIDLLQRIHADRLTSAELTGELELHLSEVEHGQRDSSTFMKEVGEYTQDIVEAARNFDYDKIYPNDEALGNCPLCKRSVYERSWFYRCEEDPEAEGDDDCPFRIWKDKSGRYIDRTTAKTLLEKGTTGELDGFRNLQGRTYKGILSLEGGNLALKPIVGSEEGEADENLPKIDVRKEPLCPCPKNNGCPAAESDEPCNIVETESDFICEHRKKAFEAGQPKPTGPVLPRIVCKRVMKREEAIAYFQKGETPLIEDFISRFGRKFKATLHTRETGKHRFEFPPREGGGKKKSKKKAAKGKASTKKKAAAKKKAAKAKPKAAKKKAASVNKSTEPPVA
ncbi:DNA topoisomerase 3 [Planctomycetes bacterium Pan216]|uniref:DNA topoisomerase n=1 Tax=Kolteria novifilia TaxID=2527975 RepID=A0A518BB48_9BACT|nr:DNA topoisomerase 3 [Planctomycetes bacterium Pan216]